MTEWLKGRNPKKPNRPTIAPRPREHLDLGSKLQAVPVLKDFYMMFGSTTVWNRIAVSNQGTGMTFFCYLLPLLMLVGIVEGHGLLLVGRRQVAHGLWTRFTLGKVFIYEIWQFAFLTVLLYLAAFFLNMYANACHQRNTLSQSLKVILHATGPLLVIQLLNGFPDFYLWLTWLIGTLLCLAALYNGIPRVLMPDAPSAFGLYIGGGFVLVTLLAVWRFMTDWYLAGKFKAMDEIIAEIAGKLPF